MYPLPLASTAAAPLATRDFHGRLDTAVTCPYYLEFNQHGISKSTGLAAVARAMNIPRHQVLAFGDGNNDVAMLAWTGIGIAMDTGRPAAIRSARATAGGPGHRAGAGDPSVAG